MSTAKSAAAEKAARLAARRHAPVADPEHVSETPAAPDYRPPQRRKVRLTLDLAPGLYDDFEDWRRRAARQAGMGKVSSADVLRALLREVMDNDTLATAVIEAVRREGRQ